MTDNHLKKIKDLSNEVGELISFNSMLVDALNSSSEGIALLDKEGKYIWLNKAHSEMFGYNPTELIGESWEILYKKEDLDFFYKNAFPTIKKVGKWSGVSFGIMKDGFTIVEENVYLTALSNGGLICTCIETKKK
tara:strand:+ start:348 stop:752 length:405 start_codon:yes stop_codon:yes gene_type:complete